MCLHGDQHCHMIHFLCYPSTHKLKSNLFSTKVDIFFSLTPSSVKPQPAALVFVGE